MPLADGKPRSKRTTPKNVPVMVRTSERRMFCECRQRWWWAYVDRLKPRDQKMGALLFGDMIHRALAAYYIPETKKKRRRGPHPAQTFIKIMDAVEADQRRRGRSAALEISVDDSEEQWVSARDLGVEMMENYIDLYGKDERYLVIHPEMPFQLIMRDGDGKIVCIYVGTTDAFIFDLETGRWGLFEHKTAKSISLSHLFLDEQASTYWTLIPLWLRENDIIKGDEDIAFMLYNFMRKAKKDQRPQDEKGHYLNKPSKDALMEAAIKTGLHPMDAKKAKMDQLEEWLRGQGVKPEFLGEISKSQPPPLFKREQVFRGDQDRANTYDRIQAQVHEMNLVRAGELEVYKAPGLQCAMCEFRDMCELHEIGSNWEELRKAMFQKWDPYLAHIWDLDLAGA